MGDLANIKNAVGTEKKTSIQGMLEMATKRMGATVPAHLRGERFIAIGQNLVKRNPKLAQCTPESFVGAMLAAAELGLEPLGGKCYLIPYNNKYTGKMEAQFQVGYKGLVDMFYRHASALKIDAHAVHEKDVFDFEYGSNAGLKHKPPKTGERGAVIGYYAIATIKGEELFKYMTVEECRAHGLRYTKMKSGTQFSPDSMWAKDFDSMAKKTVIIQLAKLLPQSSEVMQAVEADETSREWKGEGMALDLPADKVVDIEYEVKETKVNTDGVKEAVENKSAPTPEKSAPATVSAQPVTESKAKTEKEIKRDNLIANLKAVKFFFLVKEEELKLTPIDDQIATLNEVWAKYEETRKAPEKPAKVEVKAPPIQEEMDI